MGLFEKKKETSAKDWSDKKLVKEINRPDRDILSTARLVNEAKSRGLDNPNTGKKY